MGWPHTICVQRQKNMPFLVRLYASEMMFWIEFHPVFLSLECNLEKIQ
jgi:hypothetical protein